MLNVSFEKVKTQPSAELSLYNSITRIPFSLTFLNLKKSETIYSRNLNSENFIEFRFDADSKSLYEITLVSVQQNTIERDELRKFDWEKDVLYSCFVNESKSLLETSLPMKIIYDRKSICVDWYNQDHNNIEYFPISANCLLGVNAGFFIVSVILTNQSEEDINNILGLD